MRVHDLIRHTSPLWNSTWIRFYSSILWSPFNDDVMPFLYGVQAFKICLQKPFNWLSFELIIIHDGIEYRLQAWRVHDTWEFSTIIKENIIIYICYKVLLIWIILVPAYLYLYSNLFKDPTLLLYIVKYILQIFNDFFIPLYIQSLWTMNEKLCCMNQLISFVSRQTIDVISVKELTRLSTYKMTSYDVTSSKYFHPILFLSYITLIVWTTFYLKGVLVRFSVKMEQIVTNLN